MVKKKKCFLWLVSQDYHMSSVHMRTYVYTTEFSPPEGMIDIKISRLPFSTLPSALPILRGSHVRLYDLSPPLLESGGGLAVRRRGGGVVVDTIDELLHALEGCAEDAERGEFLLERLANGGIARRASVLAGERRRRRRWWWTWWRGQSALRFRIR
jgi:hypothetical protein